jgi:hypothetical protein
MPVYYECSLCGRNDKKLTMGSFGLASRMVNGHWLDLCDACCAGYDAVLQDAENIKIEMINKWAKSIKRSRKGKP